ncbi:unnamed protein product [Arabis nemorensis]|uniref:Uncharacterized protein n=1 Tax=Arabis nemorensis TaxID=586526 RepID=A0A565C5B0_9BRAS|nr:unnamed protein product [Arabis nemorensis]
MVLSLVQLSSRTVVQVFDIATSPLLFLGLSSRRSMPEATLISTLPDFTSVSRNLRNPLVKALVENPNMATVSLCGDYGWLSDWRFVVLARGGLEKWRFSSLAFRLASIDDDILGGGPSWCRV